MDLNLNLKFLDFFPGTLYRWWRSYNEKYRYLSVCCLYSSSLQAANTLCLCVFLCWTIFSKVILYSHQNNISYQDAVRLTDLQTLLLCLFLQCLIEILMHTSTPSSSWTTAAMTPYQPALNWSSLIQHCRWAKVFMDTKSRLNLQVLNYPIRNRIWLRWWTLSGLDITIRWHGQKQHWLYTVAQMFPALFLLLALPMSI